MIPPSGNSFSGGHPILENLDRGIEFAKAHPDRVIPYAAINIDSDSVIEDIRKVYDMGFKGLGELFSKNQWNYDDPKYEPIWTLVEKLGMPIMPHTGILANGKMSRQRPGYIATIASDHPDLLVFGQNGRYQIDRLKLRLLPVGPIYQKIILARFTSNFALLYTAGVTVLDCIRMGETLVGNSVIAEALHRVRRQIGEGVGLTASFENTGLFPPLVLRMLKVGESSGAWDTSLENVSYFYNRDVRESIERVQTMIEPTLTLVLGAMLGWVMMSVLGPIYDILGTVTR